MLEFRLDPINEGKYKWMATSNTGEVIKRTSKTRLINTIARRFVISLHGKSMLKFMEGHQKNDTHHGSTTSQTGG